MLDKLPRTLRSANATGVVLVLFSASTSRAETRLRLSPNKTIVVRLPLLASQPLVRFLRVRTREFLLLRIPLHRLFHPHRNHTKMRHSNRSMPDLDIADWVFTAPHGLEEVAHVVAALVKLDRVFGQRCLQQFLVARFDRPTRHENPPVRSNELDAIRRPFAFAYHTPVHRGAFIDDGHRHAVRVFAVDTILRGCRKSAWHHFF